MNSEHGGQSSSDLQRRTASVLARKKVLAAYSSMAAKSEHTTTNNSHLKSKQIDPKITSESWKKYHSAWQNYYQKYYSDYYTKAAREYIAKERQKDAQKAAKEDTILKSLVSVGKKNYGSTGLSLDSDNTNTNTNGAEAGEESLKQRIHKKAARTTRKKRRHQKYFPILAGISVVLVVLFLQYNRLIFAPIMAYVSPGDAPSSSIEAIDPTITQTVSSEPRLLIPKLNIDVPIRFNIALDEVMSAMNNGVAHYRIAGASAYPGEIGNFVITGHSAGDVYSSNPYKYIFSGLERLDNGDLIYVNYESTRYTYRVIKKEVIDPTNVAALVIDTDKPILTLVTCTPLGTSRYRLLVTAEQISPNVETASEAEQYTPVGESDALPANEPSFFEGAWNFLTGQ